ncbi:MAG: hypothetical protein H6555_07030 [Lewinellaceae bacterium]|nr:hypothetical protein [Lewinellaceae bacterium]
MADLWDYFKGLFRKAEVSSPSQPLIHEMLVRSETEQADYVHWRETLVCRRLRDWLSDQYAIFHVLPQDIDEALDFLDTPSSKGFVIHFHKTRYSKRDVIHFLDYLKDQVLSLQYRTQISDLRTYERPQWVETVQRHYLKPRPAATDEGKFHQGYGNIRIELLFRNDEPYNLKFSATAYQDHQFQKATSFRELMQAILA